MEGISSAASRFIIKSFLLLLVLTVAVFGFISMFVSSTSAQALNDVGTIYMNGVSDKNADHFETIISLRISQLSAITATVLPHDYGNQKDLLAALKQNAEARGFACFELLGKDGVSQPVISQITHIEDEKQFVAQLFDGQVQVASGMAQDQRMIIFGVPASYPMEDQNSAALVAAIPAAELADVLFGSENDQLISSNIVLSNGSYVIRSAEEYGSTFKGSYFDQLESRIDSTQPEKLEAVQQLKAAMDQRRSFDTVICTGEQTIRIDETPLPYSDWFLITAMPYGKLNTIIDHLSFVVTRAMFFGSAVILAGLIFIFWRYYQMTRSQVEELAASKEEAEKATRTAEEASRAKSEFLSNMSHDIRTPMNGIVGMTAIAERNLSDPARVKDCLKKISLSSRHLLGLINDILDMSKIESSKMVLNVDVISLQEIMNNLVYIIQPQLSEKSQSFDIYINDIEHENVYCDGIRLNQVLLNLLSNAVKFTPDKGRIDLYMSQKPSEKGKDWITCVFEVTDTGIGFSEEFGERIFDSFTRDDSKQVQKTEGTGLGMAITKYIVDAMEGTIAAKSKVGQGSTFTVEADFKIADDEENLKTLPAWKALIVDDDAMLCESASENLKEIGIDAYWCQESEEALKRIKQSFDQNDPYDIILVDWKLPGLNGIETARKIRSIVDGKTPVLLISAYDWGDIEPEARSAGVSGFIGKPLFKSTLYAGLKPYAENHAKKSVAERGENRKLLEGRKFLIAEDNELNWEIANDILAEEGAANVWAKNGREAYEIFKNSPEGYFDGILMDIRMPVMDGYEAARLIRSLERSDADILIAAMTADAFSSDKDKAIKSGMDAHISKPIDIGALLGLLQRHLK